METNKINIQRQNWPFLNKSLGFDIPKFDAIEMKYTNGNLTTVYYKNNKKLVFILNLLYDLSGNLINVSEDNVKIDKREVIENIPQDLPTEVITELETSESVPESVSGIDTEEEYDAATTEQKKTIWSWFMNLF